jgi:hypothetical protein
MSLYPIAFRARRGGSGKEDAQIVFENSYSSFIGLITHLRVLKLGTASVDEPSLDINLFVSRRVVK